MFGLENETIPVGGEPAAHKLWLDFLKNRIFLYADQRLDDQRAHTSTASPFISWGALPLTMLGRSLSAQAGTSLTEYKGQCVGSVMSALAMRDFCAMRLASRASLRDELAEIMAVDDPLNMVHEPLQLLRAGAWMHGQTGIPIVDAAMRQLMTTGWIPHSLRQIVAFFLVRIAGVDWRVGCCHFARCLTDYDPASNLLHWMSIGGEDAGLPKKTPWQLQPLAAARKLDASGRYTARYVPELRRLPASLIHTPWRRRLYVARRFGLRLGVNYPRAGGCGGVIAHKHQGQMIRCLRVQLGNCRKPAHQWSLLRKNDQCDQRDQDWDRLATGCPPLKNLFQSGAAIRCCCRC